MELVLRVRGRYPDGPGARDGVRSIPSILQSESRDLHMQLFHIHQKKKIIHSYNLGQRLEKNEHRFREKELLGNLFSTLNQLKKMRKNT